MKKNNPGFKLYDAEYRFVDIVWQHEPIQSGQLAKLCEKELGWKRTTVYTVLRKLCHRGILKNEGTIVTSLIKREQVQYFESHAILEKSFQGSLPMFIAAFLSEEKLSAAEAEEIMAMINQHKEG